MFGGLTRIGAAWMSMSCCAVIEIGTNSVKMLVAEVEGASFRQLLNTKVPTRLGRGLYHSGALGRQAIERTADVVQMLLSDARGLQAEAVQIIATSAARDAANSGELASAIQSATGLPVEILTGAAEGELIYRAVLADSGGEAGPILLMDLGGGSTQFVLGRGSELLHVSSYQIGTLRFHDHLGVLDHPTPEDLARCRRVVEAFLAEKVRPGISAALAGVAGSGFRLGGAGGGIRALGKLANPGTGKPLPTTLSLERIQGFRDHLWSLSLQQRKLLEGMPQNKADLILIGVVIVECCLSMVGLRQLAVSGRSVRHGALLRACPKIA